MTPKTPGVHHIGLRCSDMTITKNFYKDKIGLPLILDTPELLIFAAGEVYIAFKKANAEHGTGTFNPFNIGLDHIALSCETLEELHRLAKCLADADIENTGVKIDETLQKLYIAFKDPDRIQWEFYMV
jgi:glyoxylase I family protein